MRFRSPRGSDRISRRAGGGRSARLDRSIARWSPARIPPLTGCGEPCQCRRSSAFRSATGGPKTSAATTARMRLRPSSNNPSKGPGWTAVSGGAARRDVTGTRAGGTWGEAFVACRSSGLGRGGAGVATRTCGAALTCGAAGATRLRRPVASISMTNAATHIQLIRSYLCGAADGGGTSLPRSTLPEIDPRIAVSDCMF